MDHVISPHDDAMDITVEIKEFDVWSILVDSRSLINILFLVALQSMGKTKKDLKKVDFPGPELRDEPLLHWRNQPPHGFGQRMEDVED